MKLPDVVGYSIVEARELLHKAGIDKYNIVVTSPPKERTNTFSENYRVVRINESGSGIIELLVCKPL